jgi:hypothetical protein
VVLALSIPPKQKTHFGHTESLYGVWLATSIVFIVLTFLPSFWLLNLPESLVVFSTLTIQAALIILLSGPLGCEDDELRLDLDTDISLIQGKKLYIPVFVSNQRYLALYDTGASCCLIHPRVLSAGTEIQTENLDLRIQDLQGQSTQARIQGRVLLDIFLENGDLVRKIPFLVTNSLFDIILGTNLFQARQWGGAWQRNQFFITTGPYSAPILAIPKPLDVPLQTPLELMLAPKKKRRKRTVSRQAPQKSE